MGCDEFCHRLLNWSEETGLGRAFTEAGLIFTEDNDVAPDVAWASFQRLREIVRSDGHFHGPPELVAEFLSPGHDNEVRDRDAKLKLYSRRGVDEYWIVDWRSRTIEVYRRAGDALEPVTVLGLGDILHSPLLPGFSLPLARLFAGMEEI